MLFLPQAEVAQCGILETFGRIIILVRLGEVCDVSFTKCFKVIRGNERGSARLPSGETTELSYSCWCFPGQL